MAEQLARVKAQEQERAGVMVWACEAGGQGGLGVSTWAGAPAGLRHESSGMSAEGSTWTSPRAARSLRAQAQDVHADRDGWRSGQRRKEEKDELTLGKERLLFLPDEQEFSHGRSRLLCSVSENESLGSSRRTIAKEGGAICK